MKYRTLAIVLIACAASMLGASCSNISEDERLIYVEPNVTPEPEPEESDSAYDAAVTVVPRSVLIEDHTGQKCPNCPEATKMVHDFQQLYGSRVVAVAIHSEAQGIMEPEGLGTELGNTYYRNWSVKFKPAGLISRMDGGPGVGVVLDRTVWASALQYVLGEETPLDIRIKAVQTTENNADIDIKIICTREKSSVEGKLQVWITEDNIVAQQDSMGIHLPDYVHNHVLRASANGTWGENVSVNGLADTRELHYTTPLSSAWKPENLAIVAFVYNDSGVEQVARRQIKLLKEK